MMWWPRIIIIVLFASGSVSERSCVLGAPTSSSPLMGQPGGRQKITGVQNDVQLESLAKFAVDQHNVKQNSSLEYVRLVSAEQQVVSGTMYYLDLEATNHSSRGTANLYEAKVWVKPWQHFKSLEEFKEKGSTQPSHMEPNSGEAGSAQQLSPNDAGVHEAAEQALKTLQQRSNSLFPYELKKVTSFSAQVNGMQTCYNLTLNVQRGSKEEQLEARVARTNDGHWTVDNLHIHS
ncbi:hypothetical protein GOP47_0013731 [Adiantum capillus-veneris]|uniref:Cysteine proteinase inhibitor n=1 Tax=Adiantum capillus-veneris TaxID=13818 RepID=A0A9D4UPB5_ADICA|nr:hypothetical protein GOP47_0013731 [Adiantum capillus-veneris]